MDWLKRLIINADDYGHCLEVNAAVEELSLAGLLGGVSILANGDAFQPAVDYLRAHPEVSIGVHLNAVEGPPVAAGAAVEVLTSREGRFAGIGTVLMRWITRPLALTRAIETEWRAQIERLLAEGLTLSHADSHQHLHAFPPAYGCVLRLCREYRIPGLRRPKEGLGRSKRLIQSIALQSSLTLSTMLSGPGNVISNDYFLGFNRTGGYGRSDLIGDLSAVSDGLIELGLHPSTRDGVPYPEISGDRERKLLLGDSLVPQIKRLGIDLTTWRTVTDEFLVQD